MSENNVCIYATAAGLGIAVFLMLELMPMLLLWAGMLYLTEVALEIKFFPAEPELLLIILLSLVAIAQGFIAYIIWNRIIWEKALNKIEKKWGNKNKQKLPV